MAASSRQENNGIGGKKKVYNNINDSILSNL